MSYSFRHAICNEVFQNLPFHDACKAIRSAGYSGIEIAPFTLADHVNAISAAERVRLRDSAARAGVEIDGLH